MQTPFTVTTTLNPGHGLHVLLREDEEIVYDALRLAQVEAHGIFRERALDLAWALASDPGIAREGDAFVVAPTAPSNYREDYLWSRFRSQVEHLAFTLTSPTYVEGLVAEHVKAIHLRAHREELEAVS